jgi:hypothetical protein
VADFGRDLGHRGGPIGGGIGSRIRGFAHRRTEILSVLTLRALSHPLRVGFINTANQAPKTGTTQS